LRFGAALQVRLLAAELTLVGFLEDTRQAPPNIRRGYAAWGRRDGAQAGATFDGDEDAISAFQG